IDNGLYFSKHYPSVSVDWSYYLRFSLLSKVYGIPQSLVRLDRRRNRNSVTSRKETMFNVSRELIRSFAYEYPDIVSKEDYNYALTTQHLMELSEYNWYVFPFVMLKCFILNPFDKRWFWYIRKRIYKK